MTSIAPIPHRLITEVHSGDLSATCKREVYHRHMGQFEPLMQRALYRGSLAGKVLEELHNAGKWDDETIAASMMTSIIRIGDEIKKEKRELSDSVKENSREIHEEVLKGIQQYAARFEDRWRQCKHIGCEIPIRWTHDGTRFASHLDLVVRDTKNVFGQGPGRLLVIDFKWRLEAPTIDYLARWQQGMLYALATRYGELLIDDFWTPMDEWPAVCWLHMPHLKVYARKTHTKDDEGNEVTYEKGESRPDHAVLRWAGFKQDRAPDMIDEIMLTVAMFDSGMFPMTPTPVGCHLCPSREWCERFDTGRTDTQ